MKTQQTFTFLKLEQENCCHFCLKNACTDETIHFMSIKSSVNGLETRVLYCSFHHFLLCPSSLLQVLCKENLKGNRGYWEVDYDGWVVIGLVCESAPRKSQDGPCGLGENSGSWGCGWSGSNYQVWTNGENVDVPLPLSSTMGIYIDQPAGIIKFLVVLGEAEKEVRQIHKFSVNTQDKIFPGFWIGTNSFCQIRKKDQ